MPTISVRALDASHDPLYGNGQANFLTDVAAVAQIVNTRILLLLAEWWESRSIGLPLFQSMLGSSGSPRNQEAVALILQQNILGGPYVTGISNLDLSYDGTLRSFQFSCHVQTQFGPFQLTVNTPGGTF